MEEYKDVFTATELKNIAKEFKRLKDENYLDHAGSSLYAESQISEIYKELSQNLYSNPHTSKHVGDCIEQIRYRILKHFNTKPSEYSVVFTSGATSALKLAVECFDFTRRNTKKSNEKNVISENKTASYGKIEKKAQQLNNKLTENILFNQITSITKNDKLNFKSTAGTFAYIQDCHTSALGLREIAANVKGAKIKTITRSEFLESETCDLFNSDDANNLFVYPAQCNFSGYKYPLNLHLPPNWFVLLDAASYVANSHLDLDEIKPNFVAISFYKIFGYPTGLGALLVRKNSEFLLTDKSYFGGGTVEIALSSQMFYKPRQNINERLEDGTISFLSILSLRHGFDTLYHLVPFNKNLTSMDRISEHTFRLAQYAYRRLSSLHYYNKKSAVKIYNDTNYTSSKTQGGIVNFNLLTPEGCFIGFAEVEHMANLYNIHLRTGCFCNPGACQRHLALTDDEVMKHHLAGRVCGDDNDLIDGIPTGSVRISFGYYSTKKNVDVLVNMIKICYIENNNRILEVSNKSDLQNNIKDSKVVFRTIVFIINLIRRLQNPSKLYDKETNILKSISNKKYYNYEHDRKSLIKIDMTTLDSTNSEKPAFKKTNFKHIEQNINDNDLDNNLNKKQTTNSTNFDVSYSQDNFTSICSEFTEDVNFYKPSITKGIIKSQPYLQNICVYPVKSCGPFKINQKDGWPVGSKGLLYDREWMIVSDSGAVMTQKQMPGLCKIKPFIDLENRILILKFPDLEDLSISLNVTDTNMIKSTQLCSSTSRICGDPVTSLDCGEEAARWLEQALHKPTLRLVKQYDKRSKLNDKQISLVNRAQYLLVNSTSVQWLLDRSKSHYTLKSPNQNDESDDLENYLDRFRANLIVSAPNPLEENNWTSLETIEGFKLKVEGPCSRCQIICIDQKTGQKSPEPLRVISNEFHGKRTFGIYLSAEHDIADNQLGIIKCGPVIVQTD